MSTRIISRLFTFLLIVLLQVALFNHIHLGGLATPLMVVYLLAIAPSDEPRSLLLLEGFAAGLSMDIGANTPGLCASALTFTAFLLPTILRHTADTDRPDVAFTPSAKEMGWDGFLFYASVLTLIYAVTYHLIAWFTFRQFTGMLLHIFGSTVLTIVLIVAIERIRYKTL